MDNDSINNTFFPEKENIRPSSYYIFYEICEDYVIPILCITGVIFNLASIFVLHSSGMLHLKKSLQFQFSFLNLFDSIFLICTLLVFGNIQTPNYTIPYIVPILQTALTVSVYSTVCIAVSGALVVRPTPDNNQFDIFQRIKMYLGNHNVDPSIIATVGVFVFGVVFNFSRWFELELLEIEDPINGNKTIQKVQSTSLRDSSLYLKYYSLIGSLIVMVLIPIIILITTCIYLRSAIPDGQHKEKISRIMIIIICMFVVAHVPKVLLTGYEITTSSQQSEWSNWALVLKEVSHLLLISYSALNPLAYCGELIWKHLVIKLWHSIRRFCFFCRHGNSEQPNNIHTEGIMMKSVGITLSGVDPMQQQLKELDAQSRLLTGIEQFEKDQNRKISRTSTLSSSEKSVKDPVVV